MLRLLFSLAFVCLAIVAHAQYVPSPGNVQSNPILLKGATIHIGNGSVLQNANLLFENGKIKNIGVNVIAPDGAEVIELTGKHIYPGLVAMNSILGLNEIEAVRATRDAIEVGLFNPEIRSIIAYNTDSEVIPTVRSNGILFAQIRPKGKRVTGQSTAVQLDAWNWEDAAIATDEGIHMNWPRSFRILGKKYDKKVIKKNEDFLEKINEIEDLFQNARTYADAGTAKDKNLKFEAMRGLFDGSKKLYIHTNHARLMEMAVLFAQKYDISPVIVGGREAWLITDFLKENNVPVVVNSAQSLPQYEDSDIDQPFKTPSQLEAAGVTWCFSHADYWSQRNLPFVAGQAVGFGLEYEAAIKALTQTPAKILGIGDRYGSLEVGKSASLIVSEGDVLDMRTSKVIHAYIDGRKINLSNKQKVLAEKFMNKYKGK